MQLLNHIVYLQHDHDFTGFDGIEDGHEAKVEFFSAGWKEQMEYMKQWDYGDAALDLDTLASDPYAMTHWSDDSPRYVMSVNSAIGYASLQRELTRDELQELEAELSEGDEGDDHE